MPDGSENPEAQIKPLAYTGSERFEQLSQLPTMKELGYDMEFCIKSWWFAPKGTPQEAIDGFASALQASTSTDRYQKFLESKGFANLFWRKRFSRTCRTWTAIQPVAKLAAKK